MNKQITIMDQDLNLKQNMIHLIQGNYQKAEKTGLLINHSWLKYTDLDQYRNFHISYEALQNIFRTSQTIQKLNNFDTDIVNSYADIFNQSNNLLEETQLLNEYYKNLRLYLELIKDLNQQDKLKNELHWAYFLEQKSKNSIDSERIEGLEKEIQELTEKKSVIEPKYIFLKDRLSSFENEVGNLKKQSNQLNKNFMSKTREINKISRDIDKLNKILDTYNEKIEELKISQKNQEQLSENEDFIRIAKKKEGIQKQRTYIKEQKQGLSVENKTTKKQILEIKNRVKKVKGLYKETEPKFKKINDSYSELENLLNDKRNLYKKLTENLINLMENNSTDLKYSKPETEKPDMVRYSSNIRDEIDEIQIDIERYLENFEIDEPENDLSTVIEEKIKTLQGKINTLIQTKEIKLPSDSTIKFFVEFLRKNLDSIENTLNNILSSFHLKIMIQKLPDKTGISFDILENNEKIEDFDYLTEQQQLFFFIAMEIALNITHGNFIVPVFEDVFLPVHYERSNLLPVIKKYCQIILKNKDLKKLHLIVFSTQEILSEAVPKKLEIINV